MFTLWLLDLLCTPANAYPQGLWALIREARAVYRPPSDTFSLIECGLHSTVKRAMGKAGTVGFILQSYRGFTAEVSDQVSKMERKGLYKWLWRRNWQPTPVFLPGKSHGQRSLTGYSPWGQKRAGHDWLNNSKTALPCRATWCTGSSF